MKKFKKVLPVLMALIILILPFGGLKAFAYSGSPYTSNGILYHATPNGASGNPSTPNYSNFTDDNLSSYGNLGSTGSAYYDFSSNTIKSFYFNGTFDGSLTIYFYNSVGTQLYSTNITSNGAVNVPSINSVTRVKLMHAGSADMKVNEFDVYVSSVPIVHTEIKNILSSVDSNNVTLTYDIPSSNPNFTGSKIYRDGTLIKTQSNIASSFVDTVPTWNKTYSYKITATYDDSFETAGQTTAAVVGAEPPDPTKIPPAPVTSLNVSHITSNSVQLDWVNSTDTDLKSVNIYKNGSLYKNIALGTSTTVTGLNPLTQYTFGVSLVDNDSNEGQVSNVVATTLDAPDTTPPDAVTGLNVSSGDSALYVVWNANIEPDLAGYNVYIDGVKFNSSLVKGTTVTIPDLKNGQSYSIKVSAVDKSGNESAFSAAKSGVPKGSLVPVITTKYSLSDVAQGVSNWFGAYWLIIAFAVSIPLSFYIASRVKLLFIK